MTGRVREAEEATEQLRAGLAAVGVTLPSLRIEPVSSAGHEPAPLIDLGRCNLATARRLAAVLEGRQP
ncbi:hypothetical protein NLX86_29320 [Streptomyces sp. A3M-1-3]|uniref:hypothetical protein n=1 Tax=Streptomyces sp. A3M-1-3 TaxID=2962044 RepID=UPI0020B688A0|nr:hypothetical protein [Streptomyces sp. A3M-1-3]MCP3822037.1 hypothetical protein [Streptomyces sp. A3M-1-3]